MRALLASKIEKAAAMVANASMAGAVAFFSYSALLPSLDHVAIKVIPLALGAIGYLASKEGLRRTTGRDQLAESATFDLFTIPVEAEAGEMLLTDRYEVKFTSAPEPLELDDILAELGPESRVVRLFDRTAMPTPAQLKSRIDAHLNRGDAPSAVPDASSALHEALAELRRSMG